MFYRFLIKKQKKNGYSHSNANCRVRQLLFEILRIYESYIIKDAGTLESK